MMDNNSEKEIFENFQSLKKNGLRIAKGLDTRGKNIKISFEKPAQINNEKMFLYRDFSIGMYSYLRTGTIRNIESIGRYCSIGPNVTLGEGEHPTKWLSTSPAQYLPDQFSWFPPEKQLAVQRRVVRNKKNDDGARGYITIGNDVWIGGGATIRRGVTIGDGAIIAGNAFVTKDVAPYSIVAGLPAKHLRYRFPQEIIEKLLDLRWWRFDINSLAGVQFDDIEKSISQIQKKEISGDAIPVEVAYQQILVNSSGYQWV